MLYRVYCHFGKNLTNKWYCNAVFENGKFFDQIRGKNAFETCDINIAYQYRAACQNMWGAYVFEVLEEKDWPK